MRSLTKRDDADMNMILTSIVLAITFAISIIVVWNVMASVDANDADDDIQTNIYGDGTITNIRPAHNATNDLISNLETFYTVGPIVLIVVAAVGILMYILILRRT